MLQLSQFGLRASWWEMLGSLVCAGPVLCLLSVNSVMPLVRTFVFNVRALRENVVDLLLLILFLLCRDVVLSGCCQVISPLRFIVFGNTTFTLKHCGDSWQCAWWRTHSELSNSTFYISQFCGSVQQSNRLSFKPKIKPWLALWGVCLATISHMYSYIWSLSIGQRGNHRLLVLVPASQRSPQCFLSLCSCGLHLYIVYFYTTVGGDAPICWNPLIFSDLGLN